jgi:hypothetical protein
MPGTDRQPSQPSSISSDSGSSTGLMSTVSALPRRPGSAGSPAAEDHHAQADADLRRGKSRAIQLRHRVAHVLQQRLQIRSYAQGSTPTERCSRRGSPHAQHVADHAAASCSRMRRTRCIACSTPLRSPPARSRARCRPCRPHGSRPPRSPRIPARFAREGGLRHAGHADQVRSVALHARDFGRRLEARPCVAP